MVALKSMRKIKALRCESFKAFFMGVNFLQSILSVSSYATLNKPNELNVHC